LENTVNRAIKILSSIAGKWEILIINDGSKDKTLDIAQKLAGKEAGIKVINHQVNQGYGATLQSGLYNAKYEWIAFTDSDGQFDFSEITKFIEKQQLTRSDLVIGYYLDRKVSGWVKLTSKIWEILVSILFGLKVKDIDCGFKLVAKKVISKIPKLESERGAFITSELLIKAKRAGFKIAEVGVHHYSRQGGTPTGRKLNVIIKSFVDLFKLWLS
jgi:glycosyltransferase involved in cell wall biosynthesis